MKKQYDLKIIIALVCGISIALIIVVLVQGLLRKTNQDNILGQGGELAQRADNKEHLSGIEQAHFLFASASRLKKSNNYIQAIEAFNKMAENHPDSILADNACFEIVKLLNTPQIKQPRRAVAVCRFILQKYPDSEMADDAHYFIAFTKHTELKDPAGAMMEYETFLESYPNSKYSAYVQSLVTNLNSDTDQDGITVLEALEQDLPDEGFEDVIAEDATLDQILKEKPEE